MPPPHGDGKTGRKPRRPSMAGVSDVGERIGRGRATVACGEMGSHGDFFFFRDWRAFSYSLYVAYTNFDGGIYC